MKKKFLITIFLLIFSQAYSSGIKLGLFQISTGTWADFNLMNSNNFYFNSLKLDAYLDIYNFKVFIGIPFQWNVQFVNKEISQGVALGDSEISLERRLFDLISPRIGIIIPVFYPTDSIWYGSYNYKLLIGFTLSSQAPDKRTQNVSLTFGINWRYFLNGQLNKMPDSIPSGNGQTLDERGLALQGSWELLPSLKLSKRFDQFKVGFEALAGYNRIKWKFNLNRSGVALIEEVYFIVPHLFLEFQLNHKLDLGFKIGVGYLEKKKLDTDETTPILSTLSQSMQFSSSLYLSFYL